MQPPRVTPALLMREVYATSGMCRRINDSMMRICCKRIAMRKKTETWICGMRGTASELRRNSDCTAQVFIDYLRLGVEKWQQRR